LLCHRIKRNEKKEYVQSAILLLWCEKKQCYFYYYFLKIFVNTKIYTIKVPTRISSFTIDMQKGQNKPIYIFYDQLLCFFFSLLFATISYDLFFPLYCLVFTFWGKKRGDTSRFIDLSTFRYVFSYVRLTSFLHNIIIQTS
jgi:hypothetical protein